MLNTYTSYPIVLALFLPSFRLYNLPTHISACWPVLDMLWCNNGVLFLVYKYL